MTSLMHTYMAHIPTISGIDIALWDLAGKITGLPVHTLLGGPFRDSIAMYSHGIGLDMLDKVSCRDWAQRIKEMPEGFTAFKNNIDTVLGVPVESRTLKGLDSLLSIAQMPGGVPVATFAIGEAGAKNAALHAAAILALSDLGLKRRLDAWRAKQTKSVAKKPK